MRNHNQPCCVTSRGHDPNRRRVQPQTACAGRNRVTIRILGADCVRTHVFQDAVARYAGIRLRSQGARFASYAA